MSMSSDFSGQPLGTGMVWFCEIYLFVNIYCIYIYMNAY